MNYEGETTALCIGNDSTSSNPNGVGSNSSSFTTETASNTTESIVINNDFVVLSDKQFNSNTDTLGNEICEGACAQNSVENGLNNDELRSSTKVSDVECSDTPEERDSGNKKPQMYASESEGEHKTRVEQNADVSNAPWVCDSSDFSGTAVFTRRRGSSSDSVDSESSSSSSSSSSSDWDSSSDTALVSDEDSVRGQSQVLPTPCAKPKRVVLPTVKTKGEFTLDDLPPIKDLHISLPEHECKELGKVVSIVDKLVVVEPHRDLPTLNLDSVLFLDNGKRAMGHVFDVFGQVKEPLYCVRFNSADHIRDSGVSVGTKVYCAPDTPYTNYVFVNQLLSLRGSDASWEQDNEPPTSIVFYSDDEEEREARRKLQHEKSKLHTGEGADGSPATQEPKPKRLNLMEERNNRRNILLNAAYSCTSQHRRQTRGRGWVAPSPDDYIIKPPSLPFSTDWQPSPQDSEPESKHRFPPPSASPATSSPLFGMCRPPQFPFTSARFPAPPPLNTGKSLFGALRSQTSEMLTFAQPPPSTQPPVRTFVGSGGLPFTATQHPPNIPLGSARSPEAATAQPQPFSSPMAHISFRPVPCPPSVLTSPPPPFGISFSVMQHPPDISTGRIATSTVRGHFIPPNHMPGVPSQQREFPDSAASKPMVFDPSQPPPNLPFNNSATCGTFNSSTRSQAFSPVSRVVISPASNPSTTLTRGASCQQPSRASMPFNHTQHHPGPQQPSPPVLGGPWVRDPWHNPAVSPRPAGVWQASTTPPQLASDMWQSRDIWQPQASGTPSCTSWQVPNSSWRLPSTSQQPVGVLSNPVWQRCDQPLGPGRPALMQFDVLRLRSPPPPPPPPSESSFYH